MPPVVFRKGLDLKEAVAADLAAAYHSRIVDDLKASGFVQTTGRLTVHLAKEFGFCYGVDRAVDYAYQTRKKFPSKRVFLTGEIIHNPHVNDRLREKGIRILTDAGEDRSTLGPDDVVILPAFGVSIGELAELAHQGCTLVDTTCGSVLNVWKNVRRYAQDGFTSVIHGKVHHEETRATASQATQYPNGHFLIVRDEAEAELACEFIRQRRRPRGVHRAVRRRGLGRLRSCPPSRADRLREPDDDADDRVAADRRDVPRGDDRPVRRGGSRDALSSLRHDLQRDAGTAGRRRRAPRRTAAGSRGGDRRLQQQQHV